MTILLVDDDPMALRYLQLALVRLGHQVVVAEDGPSALRMLTRESAQVVVLDWLLPGLDGLEVCRSIRSRDGVYVYVIFLTARGSRDDRLEGLRAGADDFLTKPVDPAELALRLEIADRILSVHEELGRQNTRLAEMAIVDELTGVKNRRRFRDDLATFFALATRQNIPLSLVMIDVDEFKSYNDRFGHVAGDEVLRGVAAELKQNTRVQDVVARYGGEEFAVLLPMTDLDAAHLLCERLRICVERHDWPLRAVTVSMGAAATAADMQSPIELVEAADRALYRAKQLGRNQVCLDRPLTGLAQDGKQAS